MNTKKEYKSFRELLKKAVGTSEQKDFAERAGISPEHLNRMLNSQVINRPKKSTLQKIAYASGIPVFELEQALQEDIKNNMSFEETAKKYMGFLQNFIKCNYNNACLRICVNPDDTKKYMDILLNDFYDACPQLKVLYPNLKLEYEDMEPPKERYMIEFPKHTPVIEWKEIKLSTTDESSSMIATAPLAACSARIGNSKILMQFIILEETIQWRSEKRSEELFVANGFGFCLDTQIISSLNLEKFVQNHKESISHCRYDFKESIEWLLEYLKDDTVETNSIEQNIMHMLEKNKFPDYQGQERGWGAIISSIMAIETSIPFKYVPCPEQSMLKSGKYPGLSDMGVVYIEDEYIKKYNMQEEIAKEVRPYAKELGLPYFGSMSRMFLRKVNPDDYVIYYIDETDGNEL